MKAEYKQLRADTFSLDSSHVHPHEQLETGTEIGNSPDLFDDL